MKCSRVGLVIALVSEYTMMALNLYLVVDPVCCWVVCFFSLVARFHWYDIPFLTSKQGFQGDEQ